MVSIGKQDCIKTQTNIKLLNQPHIIVSLKTFTFSSAYRNQTLFFVMSTGLILTLV